MGKIDRRKFCGTAILASPLLCLRAKGGEDLLDQTDAVLDVLADEIARIAADGAQNGFKAEHLRRCAGVMRTFNARMEEKGTNRELNSRLDDDDFYRLDPPLMAQKAADYWDRHGIRLNKDDLMAQLRMHPTVYREMKKSIKKLGGVRALHASVANALERKAKEYETVAFRGGATVRNGRITFNASGRTCSAAFIPAQLDLSMYVGMNLDCLCRAMVVEGALLALICLAGCVPCCAQGAFLLAMEKLLEGLNLCNPSKC
jgi:hypothetical protein